MNAVKWRREHIGKNNRWKEAVSGEQAGDIYVCLQHHAAMLGEPDIIEASVFERLSGDTGLGGGMELRKVKVQTRRAHNAIHAAELWRIAERQLENEIQQARRRKSIGLAVKEPDDITLLQAA